MKVFVANFGEQNYAWPECLQRNTIATMNDVEAQPFWEVGMPVNFNETGGDPEMRASLDRIDSDAHYEPGNLQIVCRFANRWKGADDNESFVRLVSALREFS